MPCEHLGYTSENRESPWAEIHHFRNRNDLWKFDAMRMFVAVLDSGGFAAAARKLRCSPAAVTRAVAQLEQELGASLLTRTTRSVKTTVRGAEWAVSCRRI